jgi:hypothetical protein
MLVSEVGKRFAALCAKDATGPACSAFSRMREWRHFSPADQVGDIIATVENFQKTLCINGLIHTSRKLRQESDLYGSICALGDDCKNICSIYCLSKQSFFKELCVTKSS